MTHDPVCIYRDVPKWSESCPQCNVIAKARADEREKAAKRVEAISEGLPLDPDHVSTVLLLRYAPAAARGES